MIEAKMILASVNAFNNHPIYTLELEYPRFVHSEFMTHRLFSRNAASSRAVPIEKMIDHVLTNPAIPIEFGTNNPGMQSKVVLTGEDEKLARMLWLDAMESSVKNCKKLHSEAKLHKQLANRVTEPFQVMKTIVTATEWDNFFELRDHSGAQPEIRELAKKIRKAVDEAVPTVLDQGQWHLPYITTKIVDGGLSYFSEDKLLTLDVARKISVSCCAQVSYRNLDVSIDKAVKLYQTFVGSVPFHASPFEHQATPIPGLRKVWPEGVTHIDVNGDQWSGNFKHWVQFRHLMR